MELISGSVKADRDVLHSLVFLLQSFRKLVYLNLMISPESFHWLFSLHGETLANLNISFLPAEVLRILWLKIWLRLCPLWFVLPRRKRYGIFAGSRSLFVKTNYIAMFFFFVLIVQAGNELQFDISYYSEFFKNYFLFFVI